MGIRFLKIAVVYLVIGAALGLFMGITQKFVLAPVHAHLLLLGWASLALAGLVYHFYPVAGETRLARVHFWLHNRRRRRPHDGRHRCEKIAVSRFLFRPCLPSSPPNAPTLPMRGS